MIKLVGSLTYKGKTYNETDSIGAVPVSHYNLPDSWYGGNVKDFLKTKDGMLICRDKHDNLINLAYVEGEQEYTAEELNVLDVKQLKKIAADRGITYHKNANKETMLELLNQ